MVFREALEVFWGIHSSFLYPLLWVRELPAGLEPVLVFQISEKH